MSSTRLSTDGLSLLDEVDSRLRVERETSRVRREPCEASEEAAFDRLVLPHLCPIDLDFPTAEMTVDTAHNIFLFVNPTSGGNGAATFMEAGLEHIRMTCPEPVNIWIWDIRQGKSGQKPGFIKLNRIVDGLKLQRSQSRATDEYVYVIVAGGDGTVMWSITELWAHGIDDERIALGVVPYGTGREKKWS